MLELYYALQPAFMFHHHSPPPTTCFGANSPPTHRLAPTAGPPSPPRAGGGGHDVRPLQRARPVHALLARPFGPHAGPGGEDQLDHAHGTLGLRGMYAHGRARVVSTRHHRAPRTNCTSWSNHATRTTHHPPPTTHHPPPTTHHPPPTRSSLIRSTAATGGRQSRSRITSRP